MPFPGTGSIWMNGSLVNWADAKIHVASHVIHYGSGVFEGARCYDTPKGSACFRLGAHIKRLVNSALRTGPLAYPPTPTTASGLNLRMTCRARIRLYANLVTTTRFFNDNLR